MAKDMPRSVFVGLLVLSWAVGKNDTRGGEMPLAGWGVDAILSAHVEETEVPSYITLLRESGIGLVRERDTGEADIDLEERDPAVTYRLAREAGLSVLAFAQEGRPLGRTAWGPFPADLRVTFAEGVRLGARFVDTVSAWELHNEPELAWWPDMPDRYAAHAKALYLGLKAGARSAGRDTPVLLGALGLPAGPWLERGARNGLLDYADAWNVHYYGDASQFTGFLDGHLRAMEDLLTSSERAARGQGARRWPVKPGLVSAFRFETSAYAGFSRGRVLPIWATEVGINTVTPDTWADPVRRRRQADWIVSTARQARRHAGVAAFMPFVLVHEGDGYALTESAKDTWPAWDAYAQFVRENPFPRRPAFRSGPNAANPVVLQWLADVETASGHKLAAAYRWRAEGAPIRGELRIYNLGVAPVSGRLHETREPGDGGVGISGSSMPVSGFPEQLSIPAGEMRSFPLSFAINDAPEGGRREWIQFCFEEASGSKSKLGFAVERSPDLYPPKALPLEFAPWGARSPCFRYFPNVINGDVSSLWRTINGVKVLYAQGSLARFEIGDRPYDPEYPPVAAARLANGLPPYGWLRVAMRELGPAGVRMRVDLVDEAGRRFTQWENLGTARGLPATAARWLNLVDFHPYAWGRLDKVRRLNPRDVREVQLRFYAAKGPTMVDAELGFASEYGTQLDTDGEIPLAKQREPISAPVE